MMVTIRFQVDEAVESRLKEISQNTEIVKAKMSNLELVLKHTAKFVFRWNNAAHPRATVGKYAKAANLKEQYGCDIRVVIDPNNHTLENMDLRCSEMTELLQGWIDVFCNSKEYGSRLKVLVVMKEYRHIRRRARRKRLES